MTKLSCVFALVALAACHDLAPDVHPPVVPSAYNLVEVGGQPVPTNMIDHGYLALWADSTFSNMVVLTDGRVAGIWGAFHLNKRLDSITFVPTPQHNLAPYTAAISRDSVRVTIAALGLSMKFVQP